VPQDDVQVALVTGGAVRVGKAIVQMLAESGFAVVIHANRSTDEAQQLADNLAADGTRAVVEQADLRDEAQTRTMIDRVHDQFGRIDVLVNSAAIWSSVPLEQVTANEVRTNFEVNTLGTFVAAQHAGLKMVAQPSGGVIVNIGDWAIARPYLNHAAYFATKGAIPTLTRTLAVELASRNPHVRVNAVLPGPVLLPDQLSAADRQEAIDGTLVKREGSPEHIAHAVRFFVENDFVTGVSLPVDGGRTIAS
jgi:pteridine reductase